ncbi:MAG: hypothetical protein AAB353_14720, partial [Candidatus Hydrogenedentota bacterium]
LSEQGFQATLPSAGPLLYDGLPEEVGEDHPSRGDVASLFIDRALKDPAGGRLVHGIGAGEVVRVRRDEVWLQQSVNAREPLRALLELFGALHEVHEPNEGVIRRIVLEKLLYSNADAVQLHAADIAAKLLGLYDHARAEDPADKRENDATETAEQTPATDNVKPFPTQKQGER